MTSRRRLRGHPGADRPAPCGSPDGKGRPVVVEDELRGLFVIFDAGTALAGEGVEFDRFLREICFSYLPKAG
jgi:hypothetical protein